MEELIPEFKRDNTYDYLHILKSLNELPFEVGKNLLADFLAGDVKNKSIIKNELSTLHNFGALKFLEKDEIHGLIDNLLANRLIDQSQANFNKFIKVFSINEAGQQELMEPKLANRKVNNEIEEMEIEITDEDMALFKELSEFLGQYNSLQKKAIISEAKKVLCIAGAGSGKTTVLTKRIEFLARYEKLRGGRVLAITFTKKAREEMFNRLEELGVKARVETFNSFCEKVLLKNGGRVYGKRVRLASYQDKMMGLLAALGNIGIDLPRAVDRYFTISQKKNKSPSQLQSIFMNDCFSVLDYFKRKGFTDFSESFDGQDYRNAKMVYDVVMYLKDYMKTQGFRTYADQVNDVVEYYKRPDTEIPEFKHILVDEYQDVNAQQIELLDLLNPENLFCVGDPRQSIFGWRGSDINYILDFKKKHEDADIVSLKKNYRSKEGIVNLMNKSIASMKMIDLESELEGDTHMKVCEFGDDRNELNFVVRKIQSIDVPKEEIFVLARTNKQLQNLSDLMKREGIPHILKAEESGEAQVKEGRVTLSTIHAIKGLEAELVFVCGCNNFNFPCKASEHPIMEIVKMYDYDREEEEKRLFYVAISRARSQLYLTYTKKPTYFINKEMKEMMDILKF